MGFDDGSLGYCHLLRNVLLFGEFTLRYDGTVLEIGSWAVTYVPYRTANSRWAHSDTLGACSVPPSGKTVQIEK